MYPKQALDRETIEEAKDKLYILLPLGLVLLGLFVFSIIGV